MVVEVRLFGHLRRYLPQGRGESKVKLEIEKGARVSCLLKRLDLPADEPVLVLVNGLHASLDQQLSSGDVVSLFPPLGGG